MTLKECRKFETYTQADCARFLGVSMCTFQLWERGVGFPNAHNYKKLCSLFEVEGFDGLEKKNITK